MISTHALSAKFVTKLTEFEMRLCFI